jgi:SAM-dependent methyltransferase
MNWRTKSRLTRIFAALPFGERLYLIAQERFGRLTSDPTDRLSTAADVARWLNTDGRSVEGLIVLEVGTGHKPVLPVGLFLLGAAMVYTVDLNRRLHERLTTQALRWIVDHRAEVEAMYDGLVDASLLSARIAMIDRLAHRPLVLLEEAGIRYLAPADAARTHLSDGSIDLHVSVAVLEHISPDVLAGIMSEARRLLRPGGRALHVVDTSDHFAHEDESLSRINFLRYSDTEWMQLAGNQFAYCSRLRASDYAAIFEQAGFEIRRMERDIDRDALEQVAGGFPLAPPFSRYAPRDVCTTEIRVLLA